MTLNTRQKKISGALSIALVAIIAVFGYTTMIASAASDVVQDPKGDHLSATESANSVSATTPEDTARDYLDIKSVKVTKPKGKDQYVFSMTLGGPVPKNPSTENCYGLLGDPNDTETVLMNPPDPSKCFFAWNWDLDDDGVLVGPNPIAPTVRWINGAWQGIAFRSAGPPIVFEDIAVDGASISASVDASIIEAELDVSDGFNFVGVTRNHRIDFGGNPLVGVADFTDMAAFGD